MNHKYDINCIGNIGCTIQPNQYVVLKNEKNRGLIKIHNTFNNIQTISPSVHIQKTFGSDNMNNILSPINVPNHQPIGWGNKHLLIEVILLNKDLSLHGSRELPDEIQRYILMNRITMNELCGLIPPIPGSESLQFTIKNYLGFRLSQWKQIPTSVVNHKLENTMVLNVTSGIISYSCTPDATTCTYLEPSCLPKGESWIEVAFQVPKFTYQQKKLFVPLEKYFKDISTAGCISLLQKIIRKRPHTLIHPDTKERFTADIVLRALTEYLLCPTTPGIFIPNSGTYVTARQQYFKRMLIISAEDSEYSIKVSNRLAFAALLASRNVEWIPNPEEWFPIAIDLWKSHCTSEYQTITLDSSTLESKPLIEHMPALIHQVLGGMRRDQMMLRWIRDNPRNTVIGNTEFNTELSLDIYADQHIDGRVCFLYPIDIMGPPSAPFSPTLSKLFQEFSGLNHRRNPSTKLTSYQKKVYRSMQTMSRMIRKITPKFPANSKETISYILPDGHLAGMITPTTIKGCFVTVNPNNLNCFVVIKKPSRNTRLQDLTNHLKQHVLTIYKKKLLNGLKIGCNTFMYKNMKWSINGVPWKKYRIQVYSLTRKYQKLPIDFLNMYSNEVIQWVVSKLSGYQQLIKFPRVNRDGSGTKTALTGFEARGYHLIFELSQLYPDALWLSSKTPFAFETRCIHLRHLIRKQLRAKLTIDSKWCKEFNDPRVLLPLQKEALTQMLQAQRNNMGVFLWMRVGSGKTRTVLEFIARSKKSNRVLWCLPKSAIASVALEITKVNFKYKILSATKGTKFNDSLEVTRDSNLVPGVITLILHDHIRMVVNELSPQMMDTTLVYDECHKAMAGKTKRTTYALILAKLACQMIALTGTPIVNSTAYPLMEWLKMCVPFEVTTRNFWCAANVMVSKLALTEVKVYNKEIIVPVNVKKYLPPRLGGVAVHPNYKKAYLKSRAAVDKYLVDFTYRLVYNKRKSFKKSPLTKTHIEEVLLTKKYSPSDKLFWHMSQRPFIIAETQKHAIELIRKLIARGVPSIDIMLIGGTRLNLSKEIRHQTSACINEDDLYQFDDEKPPKICVAAISNCEGYSLCYMTCMVSGVYPSNQAKRTQMEGRINRVNCQRLHRNYFYIMGGLTTYIYKYHRNAKNLEKALTELASSSSNQIF